MDRLDAMKVFCCVVDAGGFRRAAERLGISTSSVTNQVAALEARFRVKLLHRTTHSMSLTDEGRQCYENAIRLLSDMADLEETLRDSNVAPGGLLRVEMPGILGRNIVAPALPRFLTTYPDISLRMSGNDRLIDMVEDGVDVLVRIGHLADSRLVAQTLAQTRYVFCAAPDYLARRGVPQTPEDLNNFDCLKFVYPKSRRIRPWYFQQNEHVSSQALNGVFATDHVETLIETAMAGGGIIQVLSISVQEKIASGALLPILSDYAPAGPDVAVIFQQRHLRAAKVKVFVEFLQQTFRQYRDKGAQPSAGAAAQAGKVPLA